MSPQLLDFGDERTSQAAAILAAMQKGRKLSPIDALNEFNCFRLGARIWEIKKSGVDVQDEWFVLPSGKRVKRYFVVALRAVTE